MSPAEQFKALLYVSAPSANDIADFLNQSSHNERLEVLYSLKQKDQQHLWDIAEGCPISIDDLVPKATPMLTPISFFGYNTMPVCALRKFKKMFYQYNEFNFEEVGAATYGCNKQWSSFLVGPGYFRVSPVKGEHELLFDYSYQPGRKPNHFQAIRSNDTGLAKLIYGDLTDRARKVSQHFLISKATQKKTVVYFALCKDTSSCK